MSPLFVIFLTVFIDMVGFGIVIPVLPLYAEHFHATPVEIGWLTGIYSGMQIIFMPILGRLSDRFGRRPVLIVSLTGTALGFLVMGWASSLPLLFAARIIDGATGGNISTAQAYIADVSTPENRSRSMGLIGVAFGLGFTFGPVIGGILSRSRTGAFLFRRGARSVNVVLLYFILPESLSPEYRSRPHERTRLAEVFRHGHAACLARSSPLIFHDHRLAIMTTLFALFTEKHFGFDHARPVTCWVYRDHQRHSPGRVDRRLIKYSVKLRSPALVCSCLLAHWRSCPSSRRCRCCSSSARCSRSPTASLTRR